MTDRPISPHIQIYKLPLVALISITHRIMGVIVCLGFLCLVTCLSFATLSVESYVWVSSLLMSGVGMAGIFVFVSAVAIYTVTDIRYMIWAYGIGFEKASVKKSNTVVIIMSLILVLVYNGYVFFDYFKID